MTTHHIIIMLIVKGPNETNITISVLTVLIIKRDEWTANNK